MTVLALTWVGYIKVALGAIVLVAGGIAAIGAAAGYLKDWLRGGGNLAQRIWQSVRRRPAGQAAHDNAGEHAKESAAEQVRVLNAVHQYFLKHGRPAPFWELDKVLDREGVPLRQNAESLPRGLLIPDVTPRGGAFHSDDELMVTVEGLRYCEDGMATLDLLARVLAFMAKFEKAFMPTATQPQPVVHVTEVHEALGLSAVELEKVRLLVNQLEWRSVNGSWHDMKGSWTFTLDPESIRRFRGIHDGSEYLLARAGAQSFAYRLDEEEEAAQGGRDAR
jgi:hypothetical protein